MRFFADSYALGFKNTIVPILSKLGNTESAVVFPCWTGPYGWYKQGPLAGFNPGPPFNPVDIRSGDFASGHMDFLLCGRHNAVAPGIEEDVHDRYTVLFSSFLSDIMRCSSMLGGNVYPSKFFCIQTHTGGRILEHPMAASYRLLSFIGHGAKAVIFYTYDGYLPNGELEDTWRNIPETYGPLARAMEIVGKSEKLLYTGRPRRGNVAILYPYASKLPQV
jgi:hypothetical protein